MNLKDKLFNQLKTGGKTLDELQANVGNVPKKEIAACLDQQIKKGWVEKSGNIYTLKHIFDPPLRQLQKAKNRDWVYEDIQGAVTRPVSYMNPYVDWLPCITQGNRGTCFRGNVRVLMQDFSYKPIKDVRIGEVVITHLGNKRRVVDTFKRKWQGKTYKLQLYGIHTPLECTAEHPILTKTGWKNAEDITRDDFVAVPTLSNVVKDNTIYDFERDPEFLWVLGLYLAEGSLCDRRVLFSLHAKETHLAEKVKSVMARYGTTTTIRQKGDNGLIVAVAGRQWVNYFKDAGNEYCDKKRINARLMTLEPELQYNIYDGWFEGDGHINERRPTSTFVGVSTSETLIRQLQHILLRNNIHANTQKRKDTEGKLSSYVLELNKTPRGYFEDGYYWCKIRSIEKIQQYLGEHVYNLEVEGDNTYIAETIAAHNCVGHSGAYLSWLIQLKLLAEQLGLKKEDVLFREDMQVNVFGQCIMSTEKLHFMAPSAEGVYDESRRIEGVTVPSGSYIRGAIRALKDYGYNYEKDRMTSDDEKCAPMYYPIVGDEANTKKLLAEQAAEHRLDGYAEVNSWDGVKDAIWKYGACLVAVDLYENMEQNGCSGVFPDPRGGVIGSHALCACGYDENYIYVIHSWGNYWSKIGGFSKRYFTAAAGTSYVGIDSKDVGIAKDLYSVVNVVSNIPANINIAGDAYNGVLTAKASVKVGSSYQIRITPSNPLYEPPAYTFDKVKLKEEETYTVDFQKRDNKSWIKKMIDAYLCKYLHKNC